MAISAAVGTGAVQAARKAVALSAELKHAAAGIKYAVGEQMKVVRLGRALTPDKAPRLVNGNWFAPDNKPLMAVVTTKPGTGVASGTTGMALVNPANGTFYPGNVTKGAHPMNAFFGPLQLNGVTFPSRKYTPKEVDGLTALANSVPDQSVIANAEATFRRYNMVTWGKAKPKGVLTEIPLTEGNMNVTALVLNPKPNKAVNMVVLQRTGGFTGGTDYSAPLDLAHLPKSLPPRTPRA